MSALIRSYRRFWGGVQEKIVLQKDPPLAIPRRSHHLALSCCHPGFGAITSLKTQYSQCPGSFSATGVRVRASFRFHAVGHSRFEHAWIIGHAYGPDAFDIAALGRLGRGSGRLLAIR